MATKVGPLRAVLGMVLCAVTVTHGLITQGIHIRTGFGAFLSKILQQKCVSDVMGKFINISVLASLLAFTSPSFAQDEPSYEEAVSFLVKKLNTEDTSNSYRFVEHEVASTSKCVVEISTKETKTENHNFWKKTIQSFNLGDLDPSRTKLYVDSTNVFLESFEKRDVVNHSTTFSPAWSKQDNLESHKYVCSYEGCTTPKLMTNAVSVTGVVWPKSENAPRVAKAFNHLIELCGGKKELF